MSHFYGTLQGNRGEATRAGTESSGLSTFAAGWQGAISVIVYVDPETEADMAEICLVPWESSGGIRHHIATIPLNARDPSPPARQGVMTIDEKIAEMSDTFLKIQKLNERLKEIS